MDASPDDSQMKRIRIYTSHACSFCVRAKRLLDAKGIDYEEVHLPPGDMVARQRLADMTGRFTVPQILVSGEPIGGYDDLKTLDDAGRLDDLLGLSPA